MEIEYVFIPNNPGGSENVILRVPPLKNDLNVNYRRGMHDNNFFLTFCDMDMSKDPIWIMYSRTRLRRTLG